jgi:hypothetical protein
VGPRGVASGAAGQPSLGRSRRACAPVASAWTPRHARARGLSPHIVSAAAGPPPGRPRVKPTCASTPTARAPGRPHATISSTEPQPQPMSSTHRGGAPAAASAAASCSATTAVRWSSRLHLAGCQGGVGGWGGWNGKGRMKTGGRGFSLGGWGLGALRGAPISRRSWRLGHARPPARSLSRPRLHHACPHLCPFSS